MNLHAHAIAQDRAAGKRAGGINGENADGVALLAQYDGQSIDQRAFAGAGGASDAD
jgi:hypothetical protein